jgi:predicted 3-demethylubiquinone-9 3-methyltransferase (glyoxalase superfamily)
MFADAQHGHAEEAIQHYTRIFPNSRTEELVRYTAERGPEGKIVHARFWLSGQPMIAMDSHEARGASFNEGLSFQVMCEDQATVDRYWAALSVGGKPGPCGWLTDRFGLSWQVVPTSITQWMTSSNSAARDRAFEVMLGMGKLDIAKLQAAFQGA